MRCLTAIGLAVLLGLTSCAGVAARPTPSPSPRYEVSVTTVTAKPTPLTASVQDVASRLRARVTAPIPLLVPLDVPGGMQAVVTAQPGDYTVEYTDDAHTRTIMVMSQAPLGVNGPHQTSLTVPFRGDSATYFIDDTTDPTSKRRLYWREQVGREYSLFATGFTEADFFQIARSLQPV